MTIDPVEQKQKVLGLLREVADLIEKEEMPLPDGIMILAQFPNHRSYGREYIGPACNSMAFLGHIELSKLKFAQRFNERAR